MLAQMFHDRTLAARSPLAQRLSWRLHKAVTRRVDPTVTIDVAGTRLLAPLSHQLPFYQRAHPRYDLNIGVLAKLVCEGKGDATMIDVGANIGDSAAIAHAYAPGLPILCVDGNPLLSALLHANAPALGDVEIAAPVLLSDRDGTVKGSFTVQVGTAPFHENAVAPDVDTVTLDRLLEQHPRFAHPALLKSDTDGYEAKVLAGARQTLLTARPVLLLEYEPEALDDIGTDGLSMLASLRELGYSTALVYDSMGVPLCLTTLDATRLLADLDRYARAKAIYLDLAVFPEAEDAMAAELYARETSG